MQNNHPALQLFEELLTVPSPSGREERLGQVVAGKLGELGYNHTVDGAGNVMVRIPGRNPSAPSACLAAHLDEIGVVVTAIEPDGSLRVDRIRRTLSLEARRGTRGNPGGRYHNHRCLGNGIHAYTWSR